MKNPEAVEWLEQDYDQMLLFGPRPIMGGLVATRASGWEPGANVVRPMIEIINDLAGYADLIPLGHPH